MVLLGRHPSIPSTLRSFLLRQRGLCRKRRSSETSPVVDSRTFLTCEAVVGQCRPTGKGTVFRSTACYLCFSSGAQTTVVEKDRITAKVRDSDDFVVVTNSDEQLTGASFGRQGEDGKKEKGTYGIAMAEIVEEAEDRKQCAECNCHNLRSELARRNGLYYPSSEQLRACLAIEDVVELVQK